MHRSFGYKVFSIILDFSFIFYWKHFFGFANNGAGNLDFLQLGDALQFQTLKLDVKCEASALFVLFSPRRTRS